MRDTGFGLLSQYGLDLGTEEDVRSKLRAKRIEDAMSMAPVGGVGVNGRSLDPTGQGEAFARFGANVGNAFGEKFRPEASGYGAIPPEIQGRLDTVKQTKDRYFAWEQANPTVPIEQRMEKYQEILAEAAFKNDLPEVGIGALRELTDRRDKRAKQAAEMEKLGYDNKFAKETLDSRIAQEMYRAGKEGTVQIYSRNGRNPNGGFSGHLNADGSVTSIDENGQPRVYQTGEYSFDRPSWDPARGGGGDGAGMTNTERGDIRRTLYTAMNLNDGMLGVLRLVKDAGTVGAGNPLGMLGKTTSIIDKFSSYAENLATLASPDGRLPQRGVKSADESVVYNIDTPGARKAWAEMNDKWIRKNVPNLPKKAEYANRMIAQITELAYLKAMTNEGGSTRSLSDNDYKNSLISIGGAINDPDTLAQILLADARRMQSRVTNRLSVYDPKLVEQEVNGRAFARYAEQNAEMEAFGKPGALAPPSSGATQKPKGPPAPAGWDPTDWSYLTPEEQASILAQ